MGVAKVTLNGTTLIDTTQKTVDAGSMLSAKTALNKAGENVTGTIITKSSSDLTASGSTVTVPAGYYSSSASKSVSSGSATAPSTISGSSATVSTGTNTLTLSKTVSVTPSVTSGYISSGTAGNSSVSLTASVTTKAAATITPGTSNQTIASGTYLTGAQTIAGDADLVAANIAEGVNIFGVTGTHSSASSYTATISGSGNSSYCYVTYAGTKRYTNGNTFTFKAGDSLTIYCRGNNVKINGTAVSLSSYSYTYTLPVGDITINLSYTSSTSNNINVYTMVQPTGTLTISAGGTYDVYKYSSASVAAGSVTAPSSISGTSATVSTGTNTLTLTKSVSVTPNVTTAGYISSGTAGNASVSLTANVTTKAAATITPSTSNQTIASGTYLTGAQTIAGDADLVAGNIKSGVDIFGVTGTYDPAPTYTITVFGTGAQYDCYVQLNGTGPQYYTSGDTITFKEGDVLNITAGSPSGDGTIIINGTTVASTYGSVWYNYTLPASNVTAKIVYSRDDALIEIFSGGTYKVRMPYVDGSLSQNGSANGSHLVYKGQTYFSYYNEFEITKGESITLYANGTDSEYIIIDGESVGTTSYEYTPTSDIDVYFYGTETSTKSVTRVITRRSNKIHTATITASGYNDTRTPIFYQVYHRIPGTSDAEYHSYGPYYTAGNTFTFQQGDILDFINQPYSSTATSIVYIDDVVVHQQSGPYDHIVIAPDNDIEIAFNGTSSPTNIYNKVTYTTLSADAYISYWG